MGNRMDLKKKIKKYWPYLYFVILTIIVFSEYIFSDKMLFGSDTIEAGIFFRGFYADFVKTYHRIPLWDPYIFGGLPFVDAMHGEGFFPLAAIQFFIPLHRALSYKLIAAVLMAGIFMFLYLRRMNLTKWASVFGGTAYMLSGFMLSLVYAGHDGRMYVTALLPLLLYSLEIGVQKSRLIWWWPFSAAFGLLILANHPQFAYFAMWCVGAYFVFRLVIIYRESKNLKSVLIPGFGILGAMLFGICLGFVQIWPTQDYVRNYSPRAGEGRGYDYAASWSLHSEEAISQIIPGFAGLSNLPGHPPLTSEHTYWGKNYFKINSENIGLATIVIGILGLFLYRDKYSYFFLALAVFALLYALGTGGLIFRLFYYVVPLVDKFRAPSTIMFLFSFSFSFLGARTVHSLEQSSRGIKGTVIFKWLLIISGVYLLSGIIFSISGRAIMNIYTSIFYSNIETGQWQTLQSNIPNIAIGFIIGSLIIAAVAITFRASLRKKIAFGAMASAFIALVMVSSWLLESSKFIRTVDYRPYFAKPPGISFLEVQPKPFRSFVLPGTMPNQNSLATFALDQVTGYHGNQLRWYNEFLGENYNNLLRTESGLSLSNCEFLVSKQTINHPRFELVNQAGGGVLIYRNKEFLPRARLVYQYEIIQDPDSALARLFDREFDYVNSVIIDRAPSQILVAPDPTGMDTVIFMESPPDRIKIKAVISSPGLLAVQDNWYPHWKAYEGEKELPIFRCDYTFMSVELPPGEHTVEFRIENPKYILGKNLSIISWVLMLTGMLIGGVMILIKKC